MSRDLFDRVLSNPPFSLNYSQDGMRYSNRFRWGWAPEGGKKADLIILNPATPNFASGLNRVNQIVFSAAPNNVDWVFVDGRPLKKKGKLVDVQPAAVIAAAEAATDRIRQDWIALGTFPE